jgi:uncharacterized protein YqeY
MSENADGATLKDTVQSDLHSAMRARDQVRAATLRMSLTAIANEEVAGKESRRLSDDEILKVLAKEAKKRKEAAAAYTDAGRPELAEREGAELAVLEGYLPAQLSDEELSALVDQAVRETGASGMPQMGQVMKAAQGLVAGRADGGRVATAVRSALSGR